MLPNSRHAPRTRLMLPLQKEHGARTWSMAGNGEHRRVGRGCCGWTGIGARRGAGSRGAKRASLAISPPLMWLCDAGVRPRPDPTLPEPAKGRADDHHAPPTRVTLPLQQERCGRTRSIARTGASPNNPSKRRTNRSARTHAHTARTHARTHGSRASRTRRCSPNSGHAPAAEEHAGEQGARSSGAPPGRGWWRTGDLRRGWGREDQGAGSRPLRRPLILARRSVTWASKPWLVGW